MDYSKPIPPIADEFLNWPGKDEGKPKPPIIWADEFYRIGREWTIQQGGATAERYQVAGPTKGPKPSWDEAPDWAKYLMCDPLIYYWSDCWEPAGSRVECRPLKTHADLG